MLTPRPLGSTGLRVPPIGLGTVKLGRNRALKYPEPFELPTDLQAADLLRAGQRLGVTLLDTAPAYGEAEERLGRIIGSCGGRDRWTIVTKAGEEFDAATGVSTFDFSPGAIVASVERSLRRMRTDRVECVLLHSDGDDEQLLVKSDALSALLKLKKQGKARSTGVSTKTAQGGLRAVQMGPAQGVDVVMLTLNAQSSDDLPAIRSAASAGVGVLIKKAFASGRLAEPAAAGDADPVDAALGRCLVEPGVSCVVVGTLSVKHLEQNAAAAQRVLERFDFTHGMKPIKNL